MQPERDHEFVNERDFTGDAGDRKSGQECLTKKMPSCEGGR